LVPQINEDALIGSLHLAQRRAGFGVLIGLFRAFGRSDVSLRRYSHHLTPAAYGCYGSPFDEATCLVVDGMGETGASSIFRYADGRLSELVRHRGRESVGLYSPTGPQCAM
jgi:carbamoyltransferase